MDKVLIALNSIPATAWTAFGTALIAFFGVWLTNWNNRQSLKMQLEHEERLQRQRIAKERLEELYCSLSEWETEIMYNNLQWSLLMNRKIDFEAHKKALSTIDEPTNFYRMEMIVRIYGHAFLSNFEELLGARNDLSSTASLWLQSNIGSSPNQLYAKQFIEKQPRLNSAIERLKAQIVKAAKEV